MSLISREAVPIQFARLVLVVALLSTTVVAAQNPDGRGQATLATLPQSNEALVLSSQVEQALQVGDDRLAIELIGRIMDLPSNLVAAPASRTFYPVWRHAFLLYGRLSPQGVQLYRQLYDGEVQARFDEAAKLGDVNGLRTLFHRHRVSSHWQKVGGELVARLLDRGRFGEAIEVLREMRWAGVDDAGLHDLQLAVALAEAGAWQAAQSLAEEVRARGATELADRVGDWLQRKGATRAPETDYLLGPQGVWHAPSKQQEGPGDLELLDAIDALQRLPLVQPASFGRYLVVRVDGRIRVLDRLTLTPIWETKEEPADELAEFEDQLGPRRFGGRMQGRRDASLQFSQRTNLLLANHFRHALAGDEERVYAIESLDIGSGNDLMQAQTFGAGDSGKSVNRLVARDLQTGNVLWKTGTRKGPLAYIEFQDRPLVLDGRLVVPARRGDRVNLLELDARTGELRREVPIVGPPIHFTREGGRFLCIADETTIYLTTGNGVVSALGRDTLEWKWATIYPSTVAEHLGRLWWKPPVEPRESGIDRPVLANDLLVLAPIDSLDLFAVDRFSGRERWRLPRREYTHVVGAVSAGLVVGGNALACLDLEKPAGPVRWRSVPLDLIGRSVVRGDRVYAPTRTGVVILDGATGKVLRDQLDPKMEQVDPDADAFAVLASADGLYCFNSRQLTKFPAPRATRLLADEARRGVQPYRGILGEAWLQALHEDYDAAREMLMPLECDVPAYERSRRQLLLHVSLELAERADDPRGRIEWLRQANELADTAAARASLALRIGAALEELGDWSEAIGHYCDLLQGENLAPMPGDPQRRVAIWLRAVERLQALRPHLKTGRERVLSFARRLDLREQVLMRLYAALPAGAVRSEVAARLLDSPLPPELKAAYVDEDFSAADLPDELLRRTLLERWETLVAVGELEAAREAGLLVQALPDADPSAGQRQLLRSIRLSAGKLARDVTPFSADLVQLWRIPQAELLLDHRALTRPWRRWLTVRRHEDHEIQVIHVPEHRDYPHRRTQDGIEQVERDTQWEDLDRAVPFPDDGDTRRPFWPLRRTRALAVVPVPHGLVAMGLGPERAGGQRLWEMPLGSGPQIPENLERTLSVDPGGVCVRTRVGTIARLDWSDGKTHWTRELGKRDVRQLLVVGERLLIRTDDLQVLSCRLQDGGDLQALPLTDSAQWFDVVGETVIVSTTRGLAAFAWSPDGYQLLWARATERIPQFRLVQGRPWLLLRELEMSAWDVLDATTGELIFPRALTPYQTIEHAAVIGQRLLVAGRVSVVTDMSDPAELAAFALPSGEPVWRRQFETDVSFNPTQLGGHERLIPLVLQQEDDVDEGLWPRLVLVDRENGQVVHQRSLEGDYESSGGRAACDLQVLVAGQQIVVQVDRHVLAFGAREEP